MFQTETGGVMLLFPKYDLCIYLYMFKGVLIYNYCMYRWHKYRHSSICTTGVMCYRLIVFCGVHLRRYCIITYISMALFGVLLYHYIIILITARHGFCLTMLCLSDDPAFFVYASRCTCHSLSMIATLCVNSFIFVKKGCKMC